MSRDFVGRARELAVLRKRLDEVVASGEGTALAIRGRRQVGKSRLVQEFCNQADAPYLFWAASKGASPAVSVDQFIVELRQSSLAAGIAAVPSVRAGSWPDTLRALAAALPDRPAIVVLDEVPWVSEQDPGFDGALQTAWDRLLHVKPVLLLLLGSDVHMMERFTSYDRPFYGRAGVLPLDPLNPAEVAAALGLSGADALDAYLVCGGLPGILRSWPPGAGALDFLQTECEDPSAPLFNVPQQVLSAEFPAPDHTRRVLEAIGGGERTHANIAAAAGGPDGGLPSGALSPILRRLAQEKRVVATEQPLSTRPGKPALHRIADSNLRLYLSSLRHAYEEVRRGRPAQAFRQIRRSWEAWRGKAVEPVVRQALELAALDGILPWDDVEAVGGWWNRRFDPEVDLVGADRSPVAGTVSFVGSIKWLNSPVDSHDLSALRRSAPQVPGFTEGRSGLVVVSRSGVAPHVDAAGVDLVWRPDDVLAAWQTTDDRPVSRVGGDRRHAGRPARSPPGRGPGAGRRTG